MIETTSNKPEPRTASTSRSGGYLRWLIAAAIICLAVVVYFLPIRIGSSIETYGKIVPSREWMVIRDFAGRICTTLNNRAANKTESLLVHQTERDDAVCLNLMPRIITATNISAGDTIGYLSSAEAERQLAELEGNLIKANATLRVYQTGEKDAALKEAEERLRYSTKQYQGHQRILERMKELLKRGVISEQEFEVTENESELFEADIRVAKANLLTVQTGAKPEQQRLGESNKNAFQGQIDALKKKLQRYTFIAPFSGTALKTSLSDTLFHLGDLKTLVVVMPVPWSERARLHAGQRVTISAPSLDEAPEGRIVSVGNVIYPLRGEQMLLVTVVVEHGADSLTPGLNALCEIHCEPELIGRHVDNFFRQLLRRR